MIHAVSEHGPWVKLDDVVGVCLEDGADNCRLSVLTVILTTGTCSVDLGAKSLPAADELVDAWKRYIGRDSDGEEPPRRRRTL